MNISNSDIILSSNVYDWGYSMYGDIIKKSITLKNMFYEDINIDNIQTPCGCIIAVPESYRIKSKDSTVINIIYLPRDIGYIENNIFIYINEIDVPVHFVMRGNIKETN